MGDVLEAVVGPALSRYAAADQRLPNIQALPILASDALSSVAYATEAAWACWCWGQCGPRALGADHRGDHCPDRDRGALLPPGDLGVSRWRRSYVVVRENLGRNVGLIAAAALLIDYTLTAAVSLMAGTQAISSLLPELRQHEVSFALLLLALVGWANLRGLKEAGRVFAIPTYAFVVMVVVLTVAGLKDLTFSHGFVPDPPPLVKAIEPLGLFLILRAFSSGCSAMTGIEAIANGVQVFQEPAPRNARKTLLVMGILLSGMFFAISGLGFMYGVAPSSDLTVIAQIGTRVFGANSVLLWAMQISTLLILVLAANTAFSGFPRLAAMLADDQCLPRQMRWVGIASSHQNGIGVLLGVTALIIFICRGDTTVAVNLYALGVFTAFTLSQLGLVKRWWQRHGSGWRGRLLMNALGAVATFVVLVVIVISKFDEGAWTVVIAIPLLIWALTRIRERYRALYSAMALPVDFVLPRMEPHHPSSATAVWCGCRALLGPRCRQCVTPARFRIRWWLLPCWNALKMSPSPRSSGSAWLETAQWCRSWCCCKALTAR